MTETEIALAKAYLIAADHDPVQALIRSVRDVARAHRLLRSAGPQRVDARSNELGSALRSQPVLASVAA